MSKTFRPWDVDQTWLLPPSVHDFVPAGHPAHLIREIVREELDLGAVLATYEEPRGYPPFHPGMTTALLLYACSQGIYASRRIARACEQRVDVMAVTGLAQLDFRTINPFRKRHHEGLAGLFVQALGLCRRAGLVRLGHVALDGSKIKANASKHKAMSYGRMVAAEVRLAAEGGGLTGGGRRPGQRRGRRARAGASWQRAAGPDARQAAATATDPGRQGGAGSRGEGGSRRQSSHPQAPSRWPQAQASARAAEAAAELHRPRQPHPGVAPVWWTATGL